MLDVAHWEGSSFRIGVKYALDAPEEMQVAPSEDAFRRAPPPLVSPFGFANADSCLGQGQRMLRFHTLIFHEHGHFEA